MAEHAFIINNQNKFFRIFQFTLHLEHKIRPKNWFYSQVRIYFYEMQFYSRIKWNSLLSTHIHTHTHTKQKKMIVRFFKNYVPVVHNVDLGTLKLQ